MKAFGINDGDWKRLMDDRGEGRPCLSLFMPTYRPKGDDRQDPIRLKNLLREAEQRLVGRGLEPDEAAAMLEGAHRIREDDRFWRQQRSGLAVFCSRDFFHTFHLPIEVRERLVISSHFYLRPLMPLYQTRGRFYVLALSLNQVRLLEGRRDEIRRIDLEGIVPTSFDDALGYEQYDSAVQVHTSSTNGPGHRPGTVHGHGDHDQDRLKKNILHYFQILAKDLPRAMPEASAPLVLATVQEHVPLYRSVHRGPHLIDDVIAGNPDALSEHELYERAWARVEPFFLGQSEDALARYVDLAASGRASNEAKDLVRAAEEGRVDVLLLAEEEELWGRFDPARAEVELHSKRRNGDEDLLDRAAFSTLACGGTVFTMPPERLPGGGPAAAVYRY